MKRTSIIIFLVVAAMLICGKGYATESEGLIDAENSGLFALIAKPTSLTAIPLSPTKIRLTWKDTSTDEAGFEVERKAGGCAAGGTWTLIGKTSSGVITYLNGGLQRTPCIHIG